jgi:hypothetical protein
MFLKVTKNITVRHDLRSWYQQPTNEFFLSVPNNYKIKKMRRVEHVARAMINIHRILVCKFEIRRPLKILLYRPAWEDNIKI